MAIFSMTYAELQNLPEAVQAVINAAVFILFILLCFRVTKVFLPPSKSSTSSEKKPNIKAPTPRTWRITQIPRSVTESSLREQLEGYFTNEAAGTANESNVLQLTLSPSTRGYSCATVTFRNVPSKPPRHSKEGYCFDDAFIGITPLYDGGESSVDLIVVPGLGSHALGSFRSSEGTDVWLRDFLPKDIPGIRVLLYGYDSTLVGGDSKSSISDLGKAFLESVRAYKSETETEATYRPIIFLGHSLGGLLIKEALSLACDDKDDVWNVALSKSTYALLFFGVPNLGLRNSQLETIVEGQPNAQLVRNLVVDNDSEPSQYLKELSRKFIRCCKNEAQRYEIISYYERKLSKTLERSSDGTWNKTGPKTLLVTEDSAVRVGLYDNFHRQFPLDADHSGLVKLKNTGYGDYEQVQSRLKELVKAAPNIVLQRFSHGKADQARLHDEFVPQSIQQESLQSLAFPEMNERSYDIYKEAPKTCAWLLRHQHYVSWLHQDNGLLWIKGHPGVGKSTLMKYALRHFNRGIQPKPLVASFFFHGRGVPLQRSLLGLFRSILHQILDQSPELLQSFARLYLRKCKSQGKAGKDWEWHIAELQEYLETVFPALTKERPLRLFVDALDECGEKSAKELVKYFHRWIHSSPGKMALNIIFSCRHYPLIALGDGLTICVEDENHEDIEIFVRGEIELQVPGAEEARDLAEQILERASGIFQWAVLVVPILLGLLANGNSMRKVQKRLSETPTELNNLYANILQGLREDDRHNSLKLLQWVCFAKVPLDLGELRHAMIVDADIRCTTLSECKEVYDYIETDEQMQKRIHSLSGGLVESKKIGFVWNRPSDSRSVVQFIHQSVSDYLIQSGGLQLIDDSAVNTLSGRAHFRLSRSCLKYIALMDSRDIDAFDWSPYHNPDAYPLGRYASQFWIVHAEIAEKEHCSQADLLDILQWPDYHMIQKWFQVCDMLSTRQLCDGTTLLHLAARYNLLSVLMTIYHSPSTVDVDIDVEDQDGFTPLCLAVMRGFASAVELLLDLGADVNGDCEGGCPVLAAAGYNGHGEVVATLLKRGADVNLKLKVTDSAHQSFRRFRRNGVVAIPTVVASSSSWLDESDEEEQRPSQRPALACDTPVSSSADSSPFTFKGIEWEDTQDVDSIDSPSSDG